MDRKNKPSAIPVSPSLPQPTIDISDSVLTATLPSHDTVTINLFGATVTSWKTSSGTEQLFLSSSAHLDGSKPIRGGIPLVFPVFGPPPKSGHPTSALPQHGFARSCFWEFLGKSSSESVAEGRTRGDGSVKLDFGLSPGMLDEGTKKKWPYDFGLVYSVTLGKGWLETGLHVQNKGSEAFEFMCLFHTYLRIQVRPTTTYLDSLEIYQTLTSLLTGYLQNLSARPSGCTIRRQDHQRHPPPHGSLAILDIDLRNRPRLHTSTPSRKRKRKGPISLADPHHGLRERQTQVLRLERRLT